MALAATTATRAEQPKTADELAWEKAEQRFVKFITPIIEEARARLGDSQIQWSEVRNDLLRKYMPDVRLYVRDGAFDAKTKIWALKKDGEIVDLGDGLWKGANGNQWFAAEKVMAFVKDRTIKVGTAEQAVEVVKLMEKMQESPSFVGMLRLNTKNYRVFDENFLKWMYGSDGNWKYTAEAGKDGGWVVKKEYVGPQPAMIQQPPTYDVVIENGVFVELRRGPGMKQ